MKETPPGIISSSALLQRSAERAGSSIPYWGLHVQPGVVTLIIGETSAGKTVFLHNLGRHLAAGESFLGLRPPHPLRVLQLDFESYDAIYEDHFSALGTVPGWDFLDLDAEGADKRGEDLLTSLAAIVVGRYDVLIVDPLMDAYPVPDENDNALALRQMLDFRALARETEAGVVLAHNSGLRGARSKRKQDDKFLGRGATMRPEKADVGINFTSIGERERLLKVVKSRGPNLHESIQFRFSDNYGYELVKASPAASTGKVTAATMTDVLRVAQEETAKEHFIVERKTFMERLGIAKGDKTREQQVDRALGKCVTQRLLDNAPGEGYTLPREATEA
jgi:AAA domain